MGRGERPGPKTICLIWLWHNRPHALAIDWRAAYGRVWRPLTRGEWLHGGPAVDVGAATAWDMTREILRDPRTHSYAALAGWNQIPRDVDVLAWGLGRHNQYDRPPWEGIDPLRPETARLRAATLADRQHLRDLWHFDDD